jgi:pimeloyl-ACP methyl ester carboxylesterase
MAAVATGTIAAPALFAQAEAHAAARAPETAAARQIPTGTSRFYVVYKGVRIGTETVTITRGDGTITILSNGQLSAPLDLFTAKFELLYSLDWQPRRLTIEAMLRNETLNLGTSFGLTTATNDVVQGQRKGSVTHEISARAVVLPPSYFGAYQALASRLPSVQPGARFPIYIPPEGEVAATLNRVTPRRILNPTSTTELTEYDVTLNRPGVPMPVLISVDAEGRLAKVVFGEQGFFAIRDDLSTVMSREERERNAGDSDVFIPVSSFSVGATVTLPASPAARMPAVVLVAPPGGHARDETRYGVSIFGQLAGRLADAGYLVVRFDQRGVGQSGGRPEHAGLEEYSRDVIDVVTWLRRRKDIDARRIFLVSHAEGSAVALGAAARDRNIAGVALLAAPGLTGKETVLAQQQQELARLPATDAGARVALQQRIIDAVITGKGWDVIPPDMKRQADVLWFKDWLLFDPAVPLQRANQRLLILHGALDREMPPANGERLEKLALARRNVSPTSTRRVVVPGVNHLLVPATSGEVSEYDSLQSDRLAPDVIARLLEFLNEPVKEGREQ